MASSAAAGGQCSLSAPSTSKRRRARASNTRGSLWKRSRLAGDFAGPNLDHDTVQQMITTTVGSVLSEMPSILGNVVQEAGLLRSCDLQLLLARLKELESEVERMRQAASHAECKRVRFTMPQEDHITAQPTLPEAGLLTSRDLQISSMRMIELEREVERMRSVCAKAEVVSDTISELERRFCSALAPRCPFCWRGLARWSTACSLCRRA